jgi:hypothetical protein
MNEKIAQCKKDIEALQKELARLLQPEMFKVGDMVEEVKIEWD